MPAKIISIKDIRKSFKVGEQEIQILKGITFEVEKGDFMVIFGPSGCGKSTLLHTILGLEVPSSGTVNFLGEDLYQMEKEDLRSEFRKKHIGMVYQQPNWIKSLSVIENVTFPSLLLGMEKAAALEKASQWLNEVNMSDWAHHRPTDLSSGQQQRVALARAMSTDPEVVIADEPTGNLDFEAGQKLMQLLSDVCTKQNKTVLMVTHDIEYMKFARTVVKMMDGTVVKIYSGAEKTKLLTQIVGKRGLYDQDKTD